MADNETLLAYLVPRLTKQVENAATDALGYIINNSSRCLEALNDLIRQNGFDVVPIVRVETQVTYDDGSRPDMAGYDDDNAVRLLVEAKFRADLMANQADGYLNLLPASEPTVLLFIAPDVRIETLWAKIDAQMRAAGIELEPLDSSNRTITAAVIGTEKRLLLTSWRNLLARMKAVAEDEVVRGDIMQLQGLTESQDYEPFLPVQAGELEPDFARRMLGYIHLIDNVVDGRGTIDGWMSTQGFRATPQRYGYGRYFRFPGVDGEFWFGINHEQWAKNGHTPLWLNGDGRLEFNMERIGKALDAQVQGRWVPIYLKTNVQYEEILDDVIWQLRTIGGLVGTIAS